MLWKANYDPNDRILACAKRYQSEGGGFVFNAGSTDWVLGLADPAVERITRNVLDAARK